jgi:hypothetical protein
VSLFAASLFEDVLSVVAASDLDVSLFAGAPVDVSDLPFCA